MKILLPVDGSPHTKRMLAHLAANDELLGPGHEYVFLTAVTPVPPHAAGFLDRRVLDDYYHDRAEQVLKTVRAFAEQQHWTLRTEYVVGSAAPAIATFADHEQPALIVMGTHGHSALGNVVLGSVATGVLARCKRPVLLIP